MREKRRKKREKKIREEKEEERERDSYAIMPFLNIIFMVSNPVLYATLNTLIFSPCREYIEKGDRDNYSGYHILFVKSGISIKMEKKYSI